MRDEAIRPRPPGDVAWVRIDDEIVLLDAGDVVHLISGSGAIVWPLLDGRNDLGSIAHDLAWATGLPRERLLADLTCFFRSASSSGLLEDAATNQ